MAEMDTDLFEVYAFKFLFWEINLFPYCDMPAYDMKSQNL